MNADNKVINAMAYIEIFTPNLSAMKPVITAPKAYPKSRQNRNIPSAFARSAGWVNCAMVAKKVG